MTSYIQYLHTTHNVNVVMQKKLIFSHNGYCTNLPFTAIQLLMVGPVQVESYFPYRDLNKNAFYRSHDSHMMCIGCGRGQSSWADPTACTRSRDEKGARHLVGKVGVNQEGAILVVCLFREGASREVAAVEGRMADDLLQNQD